MPKRALITGITGQHGAYLAELYIHKGPKAHGFFRRASIFNTARIDHLFVDPHDAQAKLYPHYGDICDGSRRVTLLSDIRPTEVYNLAAQSHVRGPGDNFPPPGSQVLPRLIRHYEEALEPGESSVTNLGTVAPRAEFLHVDDMAAACLHLLEHYDGKDQVNVGTGRDVTIAETSPSRRSPGSGRIQSSSRGRPNGIRRNPRGVHKTSRRIQARAVGMDLADRFR